MKRVIGAMGALALVAFCSAPAQAATEGVGDVDKGRVIFQEGKGDAPACANCHGADGLGSDDMGTPRLAYQVDTYVLKQLTDFATDKRFDNTMQQMNDIAKALSPEDRKDVAAYVNSLKTPFMGSDLDQLRQSGASVGQPYLGQVIAEVGLPDHGVPACQSCHDFHGRSAGRMYPAVGGQRYTYLKHELEAFRLGQTTASAKDPQARDNDFGGQMRAVASHMTDEDIANVAAFLTGAKPVTPGNPRAPMRQ
ncbi:MAG TPA: c-type cytochrome [Mariprofundaceae bacterium]|nr:c-type cytochrome [Mariprofundaceae bacterium]